MGYYDQSGRWIGGLDHATGGVSPQQGGPSTGYFAGNTGQPQTSVNDFWAQLDQQGPINGGGPNMPQGMNTNPMAAAFNQPQMGFQGGGTSLADLTRYFEQAGPADGDPAYWARQSLEKIQKGANVQDTLNYMTGRADFSTLGGDGRGSFGGGMGNYAPLAPFQYGGNFSTFNAPSVNAPAEFNYTGPQLQTPQNFQFPGVYSQQPQQPAQGQQQPQQARPPAQMRTRADGFVEVAPGEFLPPDHPDILAAKEGKDPTFAGLPPKPGEGYVWMNGSWRPTNDAYMGAFAPQAPPPADASTSPEGLGGGASGMPGGLGNPSGLGGGFSKGAPNGFNPEAIGTGLWEGGDVGRGGAGQRQPEWGPQQGQQAQQQTGPGGVPIFQPPPQQQMPGPFSSPGLPNSTPYQQAQTFSAPGVPSIDRYQSATPFAYGQPQMPADYAQAHTLTPERLGDLGRINQSGQIDPGQNFTYDPLANAQTYTPGQFTATTAADLANDPGYQFRQQRQQEAIEQSAAARGNLNTTGTMKALADYSGQLASQEFGNVDARRRQDFLTQEGLGFDAFNVNEANRRGVQGTQFGQAFDASQANRQASMAAQQGTFSNALAGGAFNRDSALAENTTRFGQDLAAGQFNEGNRQAAYSLTEPLKLAAQAQGYGQASDTARMNEANRMGAASFNADTSLAQNAQQFGQSATTAQMNEANRFNAATFNDQSQMARQAQQYGQDANTYGMNYANLFNQNQANFGNSLATFGANQGAQNQAFGQSLQQAGFNTGNQLAFQNQQFQQQYQPWAQNAGNQLQAGSINASSANATNALNAQQEQQRYLADWNAYQSQVSQNQFGAGMGLNYAQLGLQQQNQNFNQGLASYNTNYQTQVADPWNRNFSLAQLGAQSAGQLGGFGQDYANNLGNLYTGVGNAQAGAGIASGNAYQQMVGNLGQLPGSIYGAYQSRPQQPFYDTYGPGY